MNFGKDKSSDRLMNTSSSLEPGGAAEIGRPHRAKFRLARVFWAGLILLVLGTGPLLTVIVLAALGVTKDPNPNPIGFGILAFLTFWPSAVLVIIGVILSYVRYKAAD
jgi:hypothetical protein